MLYDTRGTKPVSNPFVEPPIHNPHVRGALHRPERDSGSTLDHLANVSEIDKKAEPVKLRYSRGTINDDD